MAPPILDRQAAVWRKVAGTGTYSDTPVYGAIKCSIVPVSRLDMPSAYAFESTHLVWVEEWVVLRKEDQLRYGRRLADAFGNSQPWTFVVNGRREFRMGVPQIAYYAREMD